MNKQELRKGDIVKVHDGSYAVRVDKFVEGSPSIGGSRDAFEVVGFVSGGLRCHDNTRVHDIHIKNTVSGEIYLHSADFVKKVIKPETITIEGLSKTYIKSELEDVIRRSGIKPVGEE